ncbi:MAG: hypothetical protein AAF383_05245 [Cyanobacteria bacterium P01_A01_bin.83]
MMSDVVKTLVPNSLKTNFRIICIQEGKTISKMIEELLVDLIKSDISIERDLNLPSDNLVVVKAYVPKELKRQFKIFCMEQKVPMNLALQNIIKRRVYLNNQAPE